MKKYSSSSDIPNIDIGKVYDRRYLEADIHYESLDKLALFFGRNMPIHHHDRFFQLHVVLEGNVRVNLDSLSYSVKGPMFFLTPPTVPHSFLIDDNATGHVVTVRQEIIWELLSDIEQHHWQGFMQRALCVELSIENTVTTATRMLHLFEMMSAEHKPDNLLHNRALKALLQLVLIDISRLADHCSSQQNTQKEDIRIFHQFNNIIEENFKKHLPLSYYAEQIGVTPARLNSICRRLAGLPSKRLIMDRLLQEARRLLMFSNSSVTEIGYHLGFKDPAYFARFFRRNAQVSASEYRLQKKHVDAN